MEPMHTEAQKKPSTETATTESKFANSNKKRRRLLKNRRLLYEQIEQGMDMWKGRA